MTQNKLTLNRFNHITHLGISNTLLRSAYGSDDMIRKEIRAIELRILTTGRIATVLVFDDRRVQIPSPRRSGFPMNSDDYLIMRATRDPIRRCFKVEYWDERGYPKELGTVSEKRLLECIGTVPFGESDYRRIGQMLRKMGNFRQEALSIIHDSPLIEALNQITPDLCDPWMLGAPIRVGGIIFFSPKLLMELNTQQKYPQAYICGIYWENQFIMFDYDKFVAGNTMYLSEEPLPEASVRRLTHHLITATPVFKSLTHRITRGRQLDVFEHITPAKRF